MTTENNKKLWFRRKRYGWGWMPITWQGWLAVFVYVAGIACIFRSINKTEHSGSDTLINFAIPYIVLTTALIILCYRKGESPKWMWGEEESAKKEKIENNQF